MRGTRVTLDTIVTAFHAGAMDDAHLSQREATAAALKFVIEKRFDPVGVRARLLARRNAGTPIRRLCAARELLVNAVVHADYSQQDAPIRVAIYDDRLEIDNPGVLLSGLTVADIKQGNFATNC